MPLRDHFRAPLDDRFGWGGLHAQWPGIITAHLNRILPSEYAAEPRVQLGRDYEVDIGTHIGTADYQYRDPSDDNTSKTTSTLTIPKTTLTKEIDRKPQYRYEVLILKHTRHRELVAALEIISPGNQDRPKERRKIIDKCSALLSNGVCVSMIDVVTNKNFNLYAELLEDYEVIEPAFGDPPPPIYAATGRCCETTSASRLDSWAFPLTVGQPLPTLPVWLNETLLISLDLEATYEEACHTLRIP